MNSKCMDLNMQDAKRWTPLMWAAYNGHQEVAESARAHSYYFTNRKKYTQSLFQQAGTEIKSILTFDGMSVHGLAVSIWLLTVPSPHFI